MAPNQMGLLRLAAVPGGEPKQGDDPGRRRIEDVLRAIADVLPTHMIFALVSPPNPPEHIEKGRREHNDEVPTMKSTPKGKTDHHASNKCNADAGERNRYDKQSTGDPITQVIVPIEGDQCPKPSENRSKVAKLKGKQKVLEGRAEKENENRCEQRQPAAHPATEIEEERDGATSERAYRDQVVRGRGLDSEDFPYQPEDQTYANDEVAVVRAEKGSRAPPLPLDEEKPVIGDKRQLRIQPDEQDPDVTTATASTRTGSRSQNGEPLENRIVGAPSTISRSFHIRGPRSSESAP